MSNDYTRTTERCELLLLLSLCVNTTNRFVWWIINTTWSTGYGYKPYGLCREESIQIVYSVLRIESLLYLYLSIHIYRSTAYTPLWWLVMLQQEDRQGKAAQLEVVKVILRVHQMPPTTPPAVQRWASSSSPCCSFYSLLDVLVGSRYSSSLDNIQVKSCRSAAPYSLSPGLSRPYIVVLVHV